MHSWRRSFGQARPIDRGASCAHDEAQAIHVMGLNEIAAFWLAYALARPIGASFADWADKPLPFGGLGLGTGLVSLALVIPIALLLTFLIVSRVDDPNHLQIHCRPRYADSGGAARTHARAHPAIIL